MTIKLTIATLSAAQRQSLERTKQWLQNLLSDLRQKSKALEGLTQRLNEVQRAAEANERAAAIDDAAATKLATAQVQLPRLRAEVARLKQQQTIHFGALGKQIATVRYEDIRKSFAIQLFQQLYDALAIEAMLKPILLPSLSLSGSARELFVASWHNSYLEGYFQQGAPEVKTIDDAESAVNQLLSELDALLKGKPLLQIPPAPDAAPPKPKPKAEPYAGLSKEEVIAQAAAAVISAVGGSAAANETARSFSGLTNQ